MERRDPHPHPTSRGVAPVRRPGLLRRRRNRCSYALDARTGKEVWTTKVADNKSAYHMSLAPLVANGKVMVGASGGEFGIRGFVAGFDIETGKEAWRVYTIPAPGEPGSETWPAGGDQWKTGGGSIWVTGNYDPATNLAYWGTGQRRTVDGRSASRRQPLHLVHDRHRRDDRDHQGPSPVPSERLVGLGRSVAADPRRLPAQRTHDQRLDRRRARRLHLVSRAHERSDQVRRGDAVRQTERVQEPRSENGPARDRSGAQAWHRQERRVLSVGLGRQELAADRLQPEDADDLHSRQRQPGARRWSGRRCRRTCPVRATRRQAAADRRSCRAPITSAKCRPGTSTPASGCGRTPTR